MTKTASHPNRFGDGRRRAGRLIIKPCKQLLGLLLRTIITSFVFYAVVVALYSMGYPVPRIVDVGHYLGRLSELAKILS
jgi:hypothetical protein